MRESQSSIAFPLSYGSKDKGEKNYDSCRVSQKNDPYLVTNEANTFRA